MLSYIHRAASRNIGDCVSTPALYFDFDVPFRVFDILNLEAKDLNSVSHIILGGGGFLGRETFSKALAGVAQLKDKKIITWALGENSSTHEDQQINKYLVLPNFTLNSLRDAETPFSWVPCASCMSPLFDRSYKIRHEVAVFSHGDPRYSFPFDVSAYPKLSNFIPAGQKLATFAGKFVRQYIEQAYFKRVLDFLGSAEYVLTNSYHGLYWATLLKRKVIAVPNSSKFKKFPYATPFCTDKNWWLLRSQSQVHAGALEECRSANLAYAARVASILSA